ncbi:MAG: DUF2391 family protein [Halodesulfurarchaeum sp.]
MEDLESTEDVEGPHTDLDTDPDTEATVGDLLDDLEELEDLLDSPEAREKIEEAMETAARVRQPGVFGRVIRGYDLADLSESLLGALLFGIPMFVEGGTYEIGAFLATEPVLLVGTHVVTVLLVIGILYVADFQEVRIHRPIFGIVPRRLVGVLGVSLVTATVMMTLWGTIDWAAPIEAFAAVSVAYLPMSIGAALGDILPGS